jgi:hypothetical protein
MEDICTPLKSRQYLGGPEIFWLVIDKVGSIGGNIWDIPVQLQRPCNTFFIASVKSGDEANTLAMSFIPMNKARGTSFVSGLTGQEQLFFMKCTGVEGGTPFYFGVLKFKEAVQQLYFHMGTENGEASRYTIGCVAGTDFDIRGGLYF